MIRLIKNFILLICFLSVNLAYCCKSHDEIAQQLNTYMKTLTNLKSRCAHISNNKIKEGTISFVRSDNPKLMIRCDTEPKQEFLIKKGWLYVFDVSTQKVISNKKLAGEPLYEILTGKFDFSKQKFDHAFEENVLHIAIHRRGFSHPPLTLHFACKNEKILNLIGWTVNDGKNITELIIDEESITTNDSLMQDSEFEFTK